MRKELYFSNLRYEYKWDCFNCYDICIIQTFFGRLKDEMYYGYEKEYESFEEFSKAIKEYIDYYNNERIQTKTKWMPPAKYRKASMCCA